MSLVKTAIASLTAAAALGSSAFAQGPEMKMVAPIGHAPDLSVGMIISDAGVFPKLIMLTLAIAMVAAIVVCVRKLRAGPNLAGGSAFLSSLRAWGPLLGLIGAGYGLLNILIGIATIGGPGHEIGLAVVAPGLIEALLIAIIGLITGVVAIAAHWAVEARIDRQVLKS